MEIAGKKVVDAKRPAKILITKRDVVAGDNKNPSGCAAALAAKRDVPDCLSARVHIGRVYIEHKDKWVRYLTPEALRTEIVAFDRGGSFQPGDYVLKAPAPSETVEGRKKYAADKAYPEGRSEAQRQKDRAAAAISGSVKGPRKAIRIARIKRHKVSGIRPKGAVR
jgi:hypothetical protein